MGNQNSLPKVEREFYLGLLIACHNDVASASSYPSSEHRRDAEEIQHRFTHEGMSFLTKTLPSLAKAVDKALATGSVLQVSGFKLARGTKLPLFMRSLLKQIFDEFGWERSDASPVALGLLRQLLGLYYKLELTVTEKQTNETISSFIKTDNSLRTEPYVDSFRANERFRWGIHPMDSPSTREAFSPTLFKGGPLGIPSQNGRGTDGGSLTGSIPRPRPMGGGRLRYGDSFVCTSMVQRSCDGGVSILPSLSPHSGLLAPSSHLPVGRGDWSPYVLRHAQRLIARVLSTVSPYEEFFPRHGPGAVATGEKGHEKMAFKRYYRSIDRCFPYDRHFFYNLSHFVDAQPGLDSLEVLDSGTAKVVLVPKDSRGPRLISCEPLENQWIQQGLLRTLVRVIEGHPLTSGRVNFTRQEINRSLAMRGSVDSSMVTLDMKDASDRVSLSLVRALIPPMWLDALEACRSTATRLPDGTTVPLRKFAPMGSAVCFPIEALIFWALAVAAIHYTSNGKVRNPIVYVYGDDIIVRKEDHLAVTQHLPQFELLFNPDKCCTHGFFRESCGLDAYRGVDVSLTRVRKRWISSLTGMAYVSYVSLTNEFLKRGYWSAADYLVDKIQKVRRTPYVREGTEAIGFVDPRKIDRQENLKLGFRVRMHPCYQVPQIKSWKICARHYVADTPGWSELLRIATAKQWELNHPIVRLAPADNIDSDWARKALSYLDMSEVTAYQYALPRQATLRRGWVNI